jgi:hypothetical protein
MSTWSVSMFPSDRAHLPRYPLVPSTDGVRLEPCPGPCGPCASSEALLDLAAFSEGNLSAAGRRRLTAHLARCRPCRLVLAAFDEELRPPEPRAADDPRGTGLVAHGP